MKTKWGREFAGWNTDELKGRTVWEKKLMKENTKLVRWMEELHRKNVVEWPKRVYKVEEWRDD